MEAIAQLVYYIPPPLLPLRLFLDKCFSLSSQGMSSHHPIASQHGTRPFRPPNKNTPA